MKKTIIGLLAWMILCGRSLGEQTLNIGWEEPNVLMEGANAWVQVATDIVITGYELTVTQIPLQHYPAQVLALMQISNVAPRSDGNNPAAYPAPLYGTGMGVSGIDNPRGMQILGGIGNAGYICSFILKSNGDESSKTVAATDLNIIVPGGWFIVCHMDQAGSVASDAEMQGVIYYTVGP